MSEDNTQTLDQLRDLAKAGVTGLSEWEQEFLSGQVDRASKYKETTRFSDKVKSIIAEMHGKYIGKKDEPQDNVSF